MAVYLKVYLMLMSDLKRDIRESRVSRQTSDKFMKFYKEIISEAKRECSSLYLDITDFMSSDEENAQKNGLVSTDYMNFNAHSKIIHDIVNSYTVARMYMKRAKMMNRQQN